MKTKYFKKPLILLAVLIDILTLQTQAQSVGIGTQNPAPSALLDLNTVSKGVLIPRVSLQSTADNSTIPSPATSLLVYNINSSLVGSNGSGQGFFFNKGTTTSPMWVKLSTVEGQKVNPRTIWGTIAADGTTLAGSGDFTVNKVGTGKYEIVFVIPFAQYPACVASQYVDEPPSFTWPVPGNNAGVAGSSSSKTWVWTSDGNNNFADANFSFNCTGY